MAPDASLLFACGDFSQVRINDFTNIKENTAWDVSRPDAIVQNIKLQFNVSVLGVTQSSSIKNTVVAAQGDFAIDAVIDSIPVDGDSFVRFKLINTANSDETTIRVFAERIDASMSGQTSIPQEARDPGKIQIRYVRTNDMLSLEYRTTTSAWTVMGTYPAEDSYHVRIAGGLMVGPSEPGDDIIEISSIGAGCDGP